jgi:hypothetical protein
MPAAMATTTWMATMAGFASGCPMAATKPTTPKAMKPTAATAKRRRPTTPRPAPMATEARTTTISRASLSFVPKRATTRSLAPGGCRSMTTCPTAATNDVAPGRNAASSSDTPSDTKAATAPTSAARGVPRSASGRVAGRVVVGVVLVIGSIVVARDDVRVS